MWPTFFSTIGLQKAILVSCVTFYQALNAQMNSNGGFEIWIVATINEYLEWHDVILNNVIPWTIGWKNLKIIIMNGYPTKK